MPAKFTKGVITPNLHHLCLSCYLQTLPGVGGRIRRYQHTGSEVHHGSGTDQESLSKGTGDPGDTTSRSQVENIILSSMFNSNAKDKENSDDSKSVSPRKNKQSRPVPDSTPSNVSQPADNASLSQRKLQRLFAEQRRKDMAAMQTRQVSKSTVKSREEPEDQSMSEFTKKSSKKSLTRAERSELRRKSEKVAHGKKAAKQSEQTQIKSTEVPQDGVAKIESQETLGVEGKKSVNKKSKGNVPGEQKTTEKPVKVGHKAKREAKRKAADLASYHISQLLALVEADPEGVSGSLHQLRMLRTSSLDGDDSSVQKVANNDSPTLSTKSAMTTSPFTHEEKDASMTSFTKYVMSFRKQIRSFRKYLIDDKNTRPTKEPNSSAEPPPSFGFMSLGAALGENASVSKRVDLDSPEDLSSKEMKKPRASPKSPPKMAKGPKASPKTHIEEITASNLELLPVKVDQPAVPSLAYGLERVLFNPGIYQLQDPRSRVYNFDPYLQKIMPITEFDFNALKEYITSSRDQSLLKIAKEHGKRYMGSTSSMTETLSQFHYLLSQWRPIDPSMLSKTFPVSQTNFTELQRAPSAIFLRWKDGSYAIDADKQFAGASVLSMLGKSMEKLLTSSTDDFERYRKSGSGQVTEDERSAPESYHYSTLGDFLMRSQLDAHDPRLPGTGMFDLKTRSVVSIRMDVKNFEHGMGYEIKSRQGEWESYEREYFDMIRAAFLKYSLQVRMGRMDGIFVAFHNIERIFGFQYISLPEMDSTIHGQWDTSIGDQEFRLSLDLLNKVLDRATQKYPETSIRIHFETRDTQTPFTYIFAEPMADEEVAKIQSSNNAKIQDFESRILGLTRGSGSETDATQEPDAKWENIQADVQQAMDKDELSINEIDQDQEAINKDAEGTKSTPERLEVFEQGPLYSRSNLVGADDPVTVASVGSEEDDGNREDNDNVEERDEGEEVEEVEEKGDVDGEEHGKAEQSRPLEELEEILEDKADVKANDAVKAKRNVSGNGAEDSDTAPKEDDMAGSTSDNEATDEVAESLNGEDDSSTSPGEKPSSIPDEEGRHKYPTVADQCFLDSMDQEAAQANTLTESSSSKDILAMTLTLRNKINGNYVQRPEKVTASDEWSIEYSLLEVSEQAKARKLYEACQRRRRTKLQPTVPENAESINIFIKNLRRMSAKGKAWRAQQETSDSKQPVQVL